MQKSTSHSTTVNVDVLDPILKRPYKSMITRDAKNDFITSYLHLKENEKTKILRGQSIEDLKSLIESLNKLQFVYPSSNDTKEMELAINQENQIKRNEAIRIVDDILKEKVMRNTSNKNDTTKEQVDTQSIKP